MLRIRSRNMLGRFYNTWVRCDGKPKYQYTIESSGSNVWMVDFCHFMRVCMFWWWLRWFFSGRFIEIRGLRPEMNGLSPFVCIILGEILVGYGVAWYRFPLDTLAGTLIVATVIGLGALVIVAVEYQWKDQIEDFLDDVKDSITSKETVSIVMEWMAAKKKGICPFVEVEKK